MTTTAPQDRYFRNWRSVISAEERAAYASAGYGGRVPVGSRPALLIVDTTYAFVGLVGRSPSESAAAYPNSCGRVGWEAVGVISRLLTGFRHVGHPIIYTAGHIDAQGPLSGLWSAKSTSQPGLRANEVVDEIAPRNADLVLRKTKPSAFHCTPLIEVLVGAAVDSLVVCGGTTSGCVRATVVDAFSLNYPVLVVEDAVFDRAGLSHAVNLFEMDQKYADVARSGHVEALLRTRWATISS